MQVTSAMSEALGKYLDLSSAQMRLTATNMANVDTPGYKTQGFDFGTEFSRALSGAASPNVEETDGLVARPDGNNVSLDREGVNLAKAQLQFKMGVSLLRSEYSRTMSAIHGDGK